MIETDRRRRPFRHRETLDEPPGRQEVFFKEGKEGEGTPVNMAASVRETDERGMHRTEVTEEGLGFAREGSSVNMGLLCEKQTYGGTRGNRFAGEGTRSIDSGEKQTQREASHRGHESRRIRSGRKLSS